jgi:EF hand domain-containing protein
MRIVTASALALLLSAGSALAADTSMPSASPSSSGRPSAVLNDSQCQSLWSQAASSGDSLSSDQATSYITDFKLADTNNDGKISQAEFKNACKLGLVQSASNGTMPKSQTR